MDPMIIGLLVVAGIALLILFSCLLIFLALDSDFTLLWCRVFGRSISKLPHVIDS